MTTNYSVVVDDFLKIIETNTLKLTMVFILLF